MHSTFNSAYGIHLNLIRKYLVSKFSLVFIMVIKILILFYSCIFDSAYGLHLILL